MVELIQAKRIGSRKHPDKYEIAELAERAIQEKERKKQEKSERMRETQRK